MKFEIDEQVGFEPVVVQRFKEALDADPSLADDFETQSEFFGRARKRLVPYSALSSSCAGLSGASPIDVILAIDVLARAGEL